MTSQSMRRYRPWMPFVARALVLSAGPLAASPARADYPVASHRYLADPASLVHEGRLYLYASNDDDNVGDNGYKMASIVCISTRDLKNWTDHGEVLRVPAGAKWASNSWAPAVIERNGKIYMYFGNSGSGIGVASSTSPVGPFTDPRGSALITGSTPGASGPNMWLFDPGVFIDDDGQAYLYFGGNGESNVRIIKLNEDMISVSGSAIAVTAPGFFEASWMHKRNGVYYFSYSTNPANGMRIDYMTSSSPTSGFTYKGTIGGQPPANDGNNNHASEFEFEGKWYHAYHNRFVAKENGNPTTYKRSLGIEVLEYEADGSIRQVEYTRDGIEQIAHLNPYERVEGETMNAQHGIETEPSSQGGMTLAHIHPGDWVSLRGVDFGKGAVSFEASVSSAGSGGTIELRLDDLNGTLIGECQVEPTGDWKTYETVSCDVETVEGVHDLYLKFAGSGNGPLFNLDYWQFTPVDGGDGDDGAGGAGASGGAGGALTGTGGNAAPGAGTGGTGPAAGAGTSGGPAAPSTGGAAPSAGGTSSAGAPATEGPPTSESGCACRAVSSGRATPGAWLGFALTALTVGRLARRRSSRH